MAGPGERFFVVAGEDVEVPAETDVAGDDQALFQRRVAMRRVLRARFQPEKRGRHPDRRFRVRNFGGNARIFSLFPSPITGARDLDARFWSSKPGRFAWGVADERLLKHNRQWFVSVQVEVRSGVPRQRE